MTAEVDWVGHKFAKYGGKDGSCMAARIEAVAASFRAVEYELGRPLEA